MAILRKGREYQLWIILDRKCTDYNLANRISGILEYRGLYSPKSDTDISFAPTPLDVRDIDITVGNKQNFAACSVIPCKTMWLSRKSFDPLDVKTIYVWTEDSRSPFV